MRAAQMGQARNNVFIIKEARTLLARVELQSGDSAAAGDLFRAGGGEWDGTHPCDGTHRGCARQGFGALYGTLSEPAASASQLDHAAAVDAFITGRTERLPAWADTAGDDAERWSLRALLLRQKRSYERVDALLAAPPVGVTPGEVAVVRAHLAIVRQDFEAGVAAADAATSGDPGASPPARPQRRPRPRRGAQQPR